MGNRRRARIPGEDGIMNPQTVISPSYSVTVFGGWEFQAWPGEGPYPLHWRSAFRGGGCE